MFNCNKLTRYYGKHRALNELSFTINDGELHGFVGPNGAGKTTTMRIAATLLTPTSGTIEIDGVDVTRDPRRVRELIGYMPDFFGVYAQLKCREYLEFYARCYSLNAKDCAAKIDQLLELVNLTDRRESYVDALSRGMKQRLCLAHALIHDPKLLILDEPASGMDPRARAEMKDILRTLRSMGKMVFISSHILSELSELCDSLTIIDKGELVFSGSTDELAHKMSGNAPLDIRLLPGAAQESFDSALGILREFAGVTGVSRQGEDGLSVELECDDSHVNALLARLLAADVPVLDYHREPMNLERVFMEVTQSE